MKNNIVPAPRVRTIGSIPTHCPEIDRILKIPGAQVDNLYHAANTGLAYALEYRENAATRALDAWQAAVLTGDPQAIDDAAQARVTALTLKDDFDGHNRLHEAVAAAQLQAYRPHAAANYVAACEAYAQAVADLSAVVEVVDPRTDAAALVTATSKQRNAWLTADHLAVVANDALGSVVLAARLAGANLKHGRENIHFEDTALSCLVLGDDVPRAKIWDAWDSGHEQRGGPISALIVAGVNVDPLPLDAVRPYSRSEPHRPEPAPEPSAQDRMLARAWRMVDVGAGRD